MKDYLKSSERVIELFKCAYDIYIQLPQEEKSKVDRFLEEKTGGTEDADKGIRETSDVGFTGERWETLEKEDSNNSPS